jgi:hypothetical protein
MKYNLELSDYNSEYQQDRDIRRIGNVVFNKGGNREDKASWLRLKEYIKRLEKEVI